MITVGKFLLNYAANIILWLYGLFLVTIGDRNHLFWMGFKYALCLIAAYYISVFLDGRPNLTVRAIIAMILAFFLGNWIGAVVGPIEFGFICIVINSFLARFGIIRF